MFALAQIVMYGTSMRNKNLLARLKTSFIIIYIKTKEFLKFFQKSDYHIDLKAIK